MIKKYTDAERYVINIGNCVTISSRFDSRSQAIQDWCAENFGPDVCIAVSGDKTHLYDIGPGNWSYWARDFYFKNEEDAMLFKLKWGTQ